MDGRPFDEPLRRVAQNVTRRAGMKGDAAGPLAAAGLLSSAGATDSRAQRGD